MLIRLVLFSDQLVKLAYGGDKRKALVAGHRARQLRNRGRFGFAREAAQPRGLNPRGVARHALPAL